MNKYNYILIYVYILSMNKFRPADYIENQCEINKKK